MPQHIIHEHYSKYKRRDNKLRLIRWQILGTGLFGLSIIFFIASIQENSRILLEMSGYMLLTGIIVLIISYFGTKIDSWKLGL